MQDGKRRLRGPSLTAKAAALVWDAARRDESEKGGRQGHRPQYNFPLEGEFGLDMSDITQETVGKYTAYMPLQVSKPDDLLLWPLPLPLNVITDHVCGITSSPEGFIVLWPVWPPRTIKCNVNIIISIWCSCCVHVPYG
jgi:hypothetical protein